MAANFLGLFLVKKGVITPKQLENAIQYQTKMNKRIADLAVKNGFLTDEQVHLIIQKQKKEDVSFSKAAIQLQFLSPAQSKKLHSQKEGRFIFLGEALLAKGYITPEQYSRFVSEYQALEEQKEMDFRFLLEGYEEHDMLFSLVQSIQRAFLRFLGARIKVEDVGNRPEQAEYALCHTISLRVRDHGMIHAYLFFEETMLRFIKDRLQCEEEGEGPEVLHKTACQDFLDIIYSYWTGTLRTKNIYVESGNRYFEENIPEIASTEHLFSVILATPRASLVVLVNGS